MDDASSLGVCNHPRVRRSSLYLGCLLLALVACGRSTDGSKGEARAEVGSSARGAELFASQCALCHGVAGRGDGPAANLLFPPPRDFSSGAFKLASTVNGVPSNADLVATLRRGMPGSAMPAWSWMSEADQYALARHVRELAVAGVYERLRGDPDLRDASDAALRRRARDAMTARGPIDVGEPVEPTPAALAQGRRAFLAHCAACHGEDGKGRGDVPRRDDDATLNWARDFTDGVLKGGARFEDLTCRIAVGLHGTAMPGAALAPDERGALIAYVQTLIPDGSEDRLVQRRATIRARRVTAGILERPEDVDWGRAEEVDLALAPLWWHDGAILRAQVAALHDGETIAVRVRWTDATPDAPVDLEWPLEAPPYADALALQLCEDPAPAFFGMASGAANIWHWRAVVPPDADEFLSELADPPHDVGRWFSRDSMRNVPHYTIAAGPIHVAGEASAVEPAGVRILDHQQLLPTSVRSSVSWEGGSWQAILRRSLAGESPRELALRPGTRRSINFAIWNGAIRDLRGQKSVTIWHALELEP